MKEKPEREKNRNESQLQQHLSFLSRARVRERRRKWIFFLQSEYIFLFYSCEAHFRGLKLAVFMAVPSTIQSPHQLLFCSRHGVRGIYATSPLMLDEKSALQCNFPSERNFSLWHAITKHWYSPPPSCDACVYSRHEPYRFVSFRPLAKICIIVIDTIFLKSLFLYHCYHY